MAHTDDSYYYRQAKEYESLLGDALIFIVCLSTDKQLDMKFCHGKALTGRALIAQIGDAFAKYETAQEDCTDNETC